MALRSLPPMINSLPSPIAKPSRDERAPLRALYKTAKWRKLRMQTFLRDRFTCQMPGCGKLHVDLSLAVADHIRPHRGDPQLFWDPANLQTLCKSPCHDSKKQSEEQSSW